MQYDCPGAKAAVSPPAAEGKESHNGSSKSGLGDSENESSEESENKAFRLDPQISTRRGASSFVPITLASWARK